MTAVETTDAKSAAGFGAMLPQESRYSHRLASFEYSLLRYSYDPASGEVLNFGVVAYSREAGFLSAIIPVSTARLSCAFPAFDTEQHKKVVSRFEAALTLQSKQVTQAFSPSSLPFFDLPDSLEKILRDIWNESGMAYEFGAPCAGVSDNLEETLAGLFKRFIGDHLEQRPRIRRDDDDLWATSYREVLRNHHVLNHLRARVVRVDDFEFNFQHTFKNGTSHILQPVSFDYKDKDGIRDRVVKLKGEAITLRQAEEPNKLYLLLGKPQDEAMAAPYRRAVKNLRRDLSDFCEIFEEEQVEDLSSEIVHIMRHAGILEAK